MIKRLPLFLFILLVGWSQANTSFADLDSTRIRIGLKLFRTILASDLKIKDKVKNEALPLVLIYKNNTSQAQRYLEKLHNLGRGKNKGKIKKIPLDIHILASSQLKQLNNFKPAGIYIVDDLDAKELEALISYGINHNIITYSPFSGAVEKGITAGLVIEARVKPYLNMKTLKQSEIQLKSFFLKVSKRYEY